MWVYILECSTPYPLRTVPNDIGIFNDIGARYGEVVDKSLRRLPPNSFGLRGHDRVQAHDDSPKSYEFRGIYRGWSGRHIWRNKIREICAHLFALRVRWR